MDQQQTDSSNYQDSFDKMREELREKFVCFICLELATNPIVLPCCGQVVCSKCLENWFSKDTSSCPYCRHQLTMKEAISIKWAEKLKKFLQISVEHCPTHHKSYEFYCKTCSCYLCPDCLFEELKQSSSKHRSHSIVKLEEMLNSYKAQVQSELLQILPNMTAIENNLYEVYECNATLTSAKNTVLRDMAIKYEEIKAETEKQFTEYEKQIDNAIEQITTAKNEIKNEIDLIQSAIRERQVFQNSNKIINFSTFQKHIETFNKIKENVPNLDFLKNPPEKNDLIVQYHTFSVYIPDFKEKNETYKNFPPEANHFFYSNKIKIDGNSWRIKIYPDGNLNGKGTHLSVFLELIHGSGFSSNYNYRLLIKSSSGLCPEIKREYTSKFDETDSWGWNKAALLETIFNGDYIDEKGGLCIFFSIRADSNYQINLDLAQAIKRKKEKYMKYKKVLQDLQNKQSLKQFDDYDSLSQDDI